MANYVRPHLRRVDFRPLVACLVLSAGVILFALWATSGARQNEDDADMTRALQLRVKHGDALIELERCNGCANRGAIEQRVRDAAAEHNAILSKHPTWTLQPLDTKGLIR